MRGHETGRPRMPTPREAAELAGELAEEDVENPEKRLSEAT